MPALAAAAATGLFGAPEFELLHLRGAWERPSLEVGLDHWLESDSGRIAGYAEVDGDDEVFLCPTARTAAGCSASPKRGRRSGAPSACPRSCPTPTSRHAWHTWMRRDPSFDPGVWFIAEVGDRLGGVALCWKEAFVKDLAVHPSMRRRGLGEALLVHAFGELSRRGVRAVALKVDSGNPTGAIRLYERVGMRVDRRYRVYERPLS